MCCENRRRNRRRQNKAKQEKRVGIGTKWFQDASTNNAKMPGFTQQRMSSTRMKEGRYSREHTQPWGTRAYIYSTGTRVVSKWEADTSRGQKGNRGTEALRRPQVYVRL